MDYENFLTNQPVVIDNGSGMIKAGFAGDDTPKCFFQSFVGRPKHQRIMAGAQEGDTFIGPKAQELRGLLALKYPMEHGIVEDWDDMEKIWQYVYSEELKTLSEEHPVHLTEAPLNPRRHRDQCAQIFFETFNVPALFISIQAVLALYASGRTTGLVLDSGDGVTHAVPVYEGFAMPHAIQRIDIAGRDVTRALQLHLRKAGTCLATSAEQEIVRIIKEKTCYLALNPLKEEKEAAAAAAASAGAGGGGYGGTAGLGGMAAAAAAAASGKAGDDFLLPDGRILRVGAERFRAPELLFRPDVIGSEAPGMHQMVVNAIEKADIDLRKSLYGNMVLSGGTTLTRGFGDRLLSEIKGIHQKSQQTKLKIFAPPERKYSTWLGGSILAALSTFRKMWVSADEYQEDPDIIHKKMM